MLLISIDYFICVMASKKGGKKRTRKKFLSDIKVGNQIE